MVSAAAPNPGPKVGDLTNTTDIVKLISNDEKPKVFFLNRDVACQSKLLAEQLPTAERLGRTETRCMKLDLPAKTLETVVRYLHYRIINSRLAQEDRANFDIEPTDALDILNAAIYLRC